MKAWREIPRVSFFLSRLVKPIYVLARWIVQRVPWAIRVNGGKVDFDGIPLVFPVNVGITYCTLGWWMGASGYEPSTWKVIKTYVQKATVFWDVGSNIGLYAVLAKKVKPTLRIEAFEPVPSLADSNRKFQMANQTGVDPRSMAVSSHGNGAKITVRKYAGSTEVEPTSSLEGGVNLSQGAEADVLAVSTTTLDMLGKALSPEDKVFIKIDVEGHENHVLRGGRNLLLSMRPIILCEILPDVSNVDEVVELIAGVNYTVFAICHEGVFRVAMGDLKKRRNYTDYLLIPVEDVDLCGNYYGFDALP